MCDRLVLRLSSVGARRHGLLVGWRAIRSAAPAVSLVTRHLSCSIRVQGMDIARMVIIPSMMCGVSLLDSFMYHCVQGGTCARQHTRELAKIDEAPVLSGRAERVGIPACTNHGLSVQRYMRDGQSCRGCFVGDESTLHLDWWRTPNDWCVCRHGLDGRADGDSMSWAAADVWAVCGAGSVCGVKGGAGAVREEDQRLDNPGLGASRAGESGRMCFQSLDRSHSWCVGLPRCIFRVRGLSARGGWIMTHLCMCTLCRDNQFRVLRGRWRKDVGLLCPVRAR